MNICGHALTSSSTQLQNRSFHVADRTRRAAKCTKIKSARAKPAKQPFVPLNKQICDVLVAVVV